MNASASDIVRALVELSNAAPGGRQLLRDVRNLLSDEIKDGGTLNVTLVTASGSEPALAASVSALVEKKYGRTVQLTQRKQASLIGGAVLQIGDEQIDLSVRGALNGLETTLQSSSLSA